MKKVVSTLNNQLKSLWNDESAQGATEYIVLLAVVVIVVALFKERIKKLVGDRIGDVEAGASGITADAKGGG